MGKKIQAEFERLKKEYLSLERTYQDEKACLLKVINTFGLIVDMQPTYRDGCRKIKKLLKNQPPLSVSHIHQATRDLRSSIFAEEMKTVVDAGTGDPVPEKDGQEQLVEAYRALDKIAVSLTDDFYPINDTMKQNAASIRFDYKKGMSPSAFQKNTTRLWAYLDKLKNKIAEDFRYINKAFLSFFTQVKELEKVLTKEIQDDAAIQGFEDFEQKIHKEVGSIVDSFSIYDTINEVKNAVVNRLSNIKQMIARKKKEEKEKSQKAQEKIHWLRKRISKAEAEARTMSVKAERFREEANKDSLTGLYNRKAFDMRIAAALESFNQGGAPFLLVMFDVDNFKWINDTFGHVAGDKVLRKTAATLIKTFRKDEFIARYGGDEFAVVIEKLPDSTALERISAFRENFSRMRFFTHKDGDVRVDVSAGIASAATGDGPEELIHKADAAMYEMKKSRKS